MSRFNTFGSLALIGSLAVGLAGCVSDGGDPPAAEEPKIDLAAEEEAVRQVNVKWLELYQAKDAEGVGAMFVEEGWTLSAMGGLTEGRAAIVTTTREELDKNPDAVTDWGAKQVWVAESGDLAVERGWWTGDEDGPGDKPEIKGEYLTVFTKVNGEWKVLADAATPVQGAGDED